MLNELTNISWFAKYQPQKIEDYVFDDPIHETQVLQWLKDGTIPGNLLLSGPAGCGKSSLASVLIHAFIKAPNDFKKIKSRSVQEIDELQTFIKSKPVQSKKKIILLEEIDKLSNVSITTLKDSYLEMYQGNCIFIATTNYQNKIESAFKTRFIHMSFTGKNIEGIFQKCKNILILENVVFNEDNLKDFIFNKYKIGLRNLITLLQINSINHKIDFNSIDQEITNSEDDIVKYTLEIFTNLINNNNQNDKKLILFQPLNSSIGSQYNNIIQIVQFSNDLYWDNIYTQIYESVQYLPIKLLCAKYMEEVEYKKIPSTHFISFLYESIKTVLDLW
jgi:DNA polymerase III delta prime subunit